MNSDNIIPGLEEAVRTVRPIDDKTDKPAPAAKPVADLGAQLTELNGLTSPEAQLKHCEAVFDDCGAEMANGTKKVLRGAVHLAFVKRHDLWQLPKGADGKPLHGGLTAYAKTYLKGKGCGCSATRVCRLVQEGNLGLDLHAAGLVLPATAEPLRTAINAKLKDAIDACRQLIAAHKGVFPGSGETEAFLATLPKKKAAKKKSGMTGWRERVTTWSDEGKLLAQQRAPYEEIEAVFEKMRVYALAHGTKANPPKKAKAAKAA